MALGDTTNSYVVAGWSASVAGLDWNAVAAQLAGASFTNGVWSGPNWLPGSSGGFFGVSDVGFGSSDPVVPPFFLFGAGPTAAGTPITNGFNLFVISPEPLTGLLAGLGAVMLLVLGQLRRRTGADDQGFRSWKTAITQIGPRA